MLEATAWIKGSLWATANGFFIKVSLKLSTCALTLFTVSINSLGILAASFAFLGAVR